VTDIEELKRAEDEARDEVFMVANRNAALGYLAQSIASSVDAYRTAIEARVRAESAAVVEEPHEITGYLWSEIRCVECDAPITEVGDGVWLHLVGNHVSAAEREAGE
jgi:hypothetical protein